MYVYAEEVFAVNFFMNYILCVFCMSAGQISVRHGRCFISATFGAAYAVACLYMKAGMLSKAVVCIIMGMILERRSLRESLSVAGCLMLGSIIISGGIILIYSQYERILADSKPVTLITGAFTGFFIFVCSVGRIRKNIAVKGVTARFTAECMGRKTVLNLLNDSGNLLTYNGYTVTVLSPDIFYGVCPELRGAFTESSSGFSQLIDEGYTGRIGFINTKSIGGEKILPVVKIDSITGDDFHMSPAYISLGDISFTGSDGIINLQSTGGKHDKRNY